MKKENMKNDKPKKKKKEKTVLTEEQIKKRKTRNSRIVACCFLLLLGVGVAGNWYWENSDISAKVSSISSGRDKVLGEATYVDATTTQPVKENAYFSSARVDRQTARDESLEKLQKIVDSTQKEKRGCHRAVSLAMFFLDSTWLDVRIIFMWECLYKIISLSQFTCMDQFFIRYQESDSFGCLQYFVRLN